MQCGSSFEQISSRNSPFAAAAAAVGRNLFLCGILALDGIMRVGDYRLQSVP